MLTCISTKITLIQQKQRYPDFLGYRCFSFRSGFRHDDHADDLAALGAEMTRYALHLSIGTFSKGTR